MSTPQDTLSSTLYISTIHISLASGSGKAAESIKLRKNDKSLREVQRTICAGEVQREEFAPPLALHPDDHVFISVNFSSRLSKRVDIDISIRDIECMRDEQGVRTYRKKAKNVEVVVTGHHALSAITPPIIQSCSQIRILVIGNCGAGKSSLIQRVFGVECVNTSDTTHGSADIDRGFISPTDERFVVHDSLGFEACDEQNVDTVKQFIDRRTAMPHLKDQLHAIWLCLEIPYAGSRLFESGVEKFLQRRDGIMGKIPLVVVLTKVDLLNTQLELDLPVNETLKHYKSRYIEEKLIGPLCEVARGDVTYVTVSVDEDYSESLSNLIKTTNENLAKFLGETSRVAASNTGCPQGSYCVQLDSLPKGPVSGFVQFQAV